MITKHIFIFLILFANAQELPETKHLDGGIFGWANALSVQRKVWSSIHFPIIRFEKSDINMAKITKEIISGRIDFNLSQIIQDMLSSIQDNLNSETANGTAENKVDEQSAKNHFSLKNILKNDDQFSDESIKQCSQDEYPNAHLIGQIFGEDFLNITDCQVIDDFVGQIVSYAFILAPLLIITVITTLFYIIFLFGRCCCCKAKKRTSPGICSIVFFIIVLVSMLISLSFCIASSMYTYRIVDYVFSKKVLDEAETACSLINPSLSVGFRNAADELIPAISNISNQTVTTIDDSLPQLMGVFDSAVDNISEISNVITNLSQYGQQSIGTCTESEGQFNTCLEENNPKLQGECKKFQLQNIELINKYSDFESVDQTAKDLASYLSNISEIMNVTSFINTGKESLVDAIDSIKNQVSKMENVTIINNCTFHNKLDFLDDLPSFALPIIKFTLFIIPIFMLIFIVFEILAFTMKNCCSRCLAGCCVPCCLCTLC